MKDRQNKNDRRIKTDVQSVGMGLFTLLLVVIAGRKLNAGEMVLLLLYFTYTIFIMQRLGRSEKENRTELERNSILIQCVTELSSGNEINHSIDRLLEIINQYFQGDRAYIFEFDEEKQEARNSFEYAAVGVTKEIDNLQHVPLEVISSWIDLFYRRGSFFISNLDQERDKKCAEYEILKAQNIDSLIAVPLLHGKKVTGFLGVDNPREHYRDFTLLSSIQYFIMNSLEIKTHQDELHYLSYRDALTGLYNRNRYVNILENSQGQTWRKVGVVYMDLNGLKKVNDEQGHEAGDRLIQSAAAQIRRVFPEQGYRIGGDEFVVIVPDVEEEQFLGSVELLQRQAAEQKILISCGFCWEEVCEDREALMKRADALMYKSKNAYYQDAKDTH